MSCPATDPSLEYLANRLHVLREQEPELPKAPSVSYTTSLEKFGCIFYFIEESDDGNIRQTFLFDAFGGLEDYLTSN